MHPSRHIRTSRFLSAVFAIAGFVALVMEVGFARPDAAAQAGYRNPGPTTVKISQSAQFISPFQINVVVTISCNVGSGYGVSVDVQQPQGFGQTTTVHGDTSGQCTGSQQKLAVSVFPFFPFFGGWQLGNAVASASACTAACGSDTKQIRIVA
jgi:hypothetical protein